MRFLGRGMAWLAFGIAVVSAVAAVWLSTSLPKISGTITLPRGSISHRVEILRDTWGIPHILAGSLNDGFAALGFVHAQDRLFQMEMMRRLGAGRLSELVGSAGLGSDRFMRTLGLYRLAERQFWELDARTRQAFTAYADGVNAWLETHRGALPPEFLVLGTEPESWRPADSLVWGKLMAVHLSGNWRDELFRLRVGKSIPPELRESLWGETFVPPGAPLHRSDDGKLAALIDSHPLPWGHPKGASNAWAVAGNRSATGAPILANDPHLGFSVPILWYLARIVTPEGSLSGATVPGVPSMIIGHNGKVAWGITATQCDVEDLFIERMAPGDPGRYLTPGGSEPFITRKEILRVRGGGDVTLQIRETRHGVVVSDVVASAGNEAEQDTVLALSAPYLREDDLTPQALDAINRSASVLDIDAALRDFHAPQQTVVFADTAGNIAYRAAGRIPIRAAGDGRLPVPGWTGEFDWTGDIPFSQLPGAINPESGLVVAANHRTAPMDYPYELGRDFAAPYRADRIRSLIGAETILSGAAMSAIQQDTVSSMALDLLPLMTDFSPRDAEIADVIALLRAWDGDMSARRTEPLIFTQWLVVLQQTLMESRIAASPAIRWSPDPAFLKNVLQNATNPWCLPENGIRCRTTLEKSLGAAMEKLKRDFGPDFRQWHWGNAHVARFAHPFSRVHPLIGDVLDLTAPTDGGNYTVNRGGMRLIAEDKPFKHVHGSGLRAVFDLANLEKSRFIIATGQSANPLSSRYGDMLQSWKSGRYTRLGLDDRALREASEGILVLTPD